MRACYLRVCVYVGDIARERGRVSGCCEGCPTFTQNCISVDCSLGVNSSGRSVLCERIVFAQKVGYAVSAELRDQRTSVFGCVLSKYLINLIAEPRPDRNGLNTHAQHAVNYALCDISIVTSDLLYALVNK